MIKIISGYSDKGGSTEAFINLCNRFNDTGYDCTFYGPHSYHLGKCKAVRYSTELPPFQPDDKVIVHLLSCFNQRPNVDKFILSCHEQYGFPLNTINLTVFDKIHFVSEHQREWHDVEYPSFLNGNIYPRLFPGRTDNEAIIAGVVGLIFPEKGTDLAVKMALKDPGVSKVLLYGEVRNEGLFNRLKRLSNKVIYMGHEEDKQKMYDSFTDLYLASPSECLPTVVAEAMLTGKRIHIPDDRNYKYAHYELNPDKVMEVWKKELSL